jgi:hypothetical protein
MSVVTNNEMSSWGVGGSVDAADVQNSTKRIQPAQDQRKFSLPDGVPQVVVTDKKVSLTYKDNGISVNEQGTILKGKVHIGSDIADVRINGFWTFNTEMLTCLPSTAYSPMPVLKYNTPPFATVVANLATVVA